MKVISHRSFQNNEMCSDNSANVVAVEYYDESLEQELR